MFRGYLVMHIHPSKAERHSVDSTYQVPDMAWLKMESEGVEKRHRKIKEMHKKIEYKQHHQYLGRCGL